MSTTYLPLRGQSQRRRILANEEKRQRELAAACAQVRYRKEMRNRRRNNPVDFVYIYNE